MANRSTVEIILAAKDVSLTSALKRGQTELKAFGGQVQNALTPFRSLISAAFSLKTALAGLATGVGISALSATLIEAGQKMDRLRLSFTSISGSGENAARQLEFVRTSAKTLGLDLETAAEAFKGISAAAQGTTLEGDKTQKIFLAVSKASTVLGLSADETKGALLAISQMISKGTVSAEELRGQLGERLPGAFQIAAQAMGLTTAELDKLMSQGMISATDFLPKFAVALENRFGPAATKAAEQFGAAKNRITSALFELKSGLGDVITNNTFFVAAMNRAATALQDLAKDTQTNAGSWRQWAKESALSILQFVADSASGFNEVYKSLAFVQGSLNLAYAGAITLGKGFQYLFEQANRATGNTEKAKYWADAQSAAAEQIDKAMEGAAKGFDNAEQGSKSLENIVTRITNLKKELEKVKADEVNPVSGLAEKAEVEFVKVGNRWIGVTETIADKNKEVTGEVTTDWGKVWQQMVKDGEAGVAQMERSLKELTRDRTVKIWVEEARSKGYSVDVPGYRTGGFVQRLARGGQLPGYGGGDRIAALLEAGEFVVRKEAVSRFGAGLFHALNSLRLPELPRFATGGLVGGSSESGSMTINLSFGSGATIPVTSTRENARALEREFRRMAWRSSK